MKLRDFALIRQQTFHVSIPSKRGLIVKKAWRARPDAESLRLNPLEAGPNREVQRELERSPGMIRDVVSIPSKRGLIVKGTTGSSCSWQEVKSLNPLEAGPNREVYLMEQIYYRGRSLNPLEAGPNREEF